MRASRKLSSIMADNAKDLTSGRSAGTSGIEIGHNSALLASHGGPCHQRACLLRALVSRPRVAQSPGLSFPETWCHCTILPRSMMSETRLATNVLSRLG